MYFFFALYIDLIKKILFQDGVLVDEFGLPQIPAT